MIVSFFLCVCGYLHDITRIRIQNAQHQHPYIMVESSPD